MPDAEELAGPPSELSTATGQAVWEHAGKPQQGYYNTPEWGLEDYLAWTDEVLAKVPDGWAKVDGKWVQLEPAKVIHWRVVRNANGGIIYDTNSRDQGRWGITMAREWLTDMVSRGIFSPGDFHIETWEQTWGSTPSTWRRVDPETDRG